MGLIELIARVRSGVVKLSLERNRKVVGNGSGFLVQGGLVTCSHNLSEDSDETLLITFDEQRRGIKSDIIRYDASDVGDMIGALSDESENDYAFLKCSENAFESRHKFEFVPSNDLNVGQQVLFLGFPFGSDHLTSHLGYISSLRSKGDFKVIQIDGSINKGNSGGPVLDLASGNVVGLITRSETGFLKDAFDDLLDSFDKNLELLKTTAGAGIAIGGVDPVKAAETTQNQLKELAKQIRRSANVGIGFAFSTDALQNELKSRGPDP